MREHGTQDWTTHPSGVEDMKVYPVNLSKDVQVDLPFATRPRLIVNAKSYHASGFDNWLGVRSSRPSKKRASVMDLVLGRAEKNDYQTILV